MVAFEATETPQFYGPPSTPATLVKFLTHLITMIQGNEISHGDLYMLISILNTRQYPPTTTDTLKRLDF